MPTTAGPIRYSRTEKLQGEIARAKADIEYFKESTRHSKAGIRLERIDDCSAGEMKLALDALKRHPGSTFQECLAALRAK